MAATDPIVTLSPQFYLNSPGTGTRGAQRIKGGTTYELHHSRIRRRCSVLLLYTFYAVFTNGKVCRKGLAGSAGRIVFFFLLMLSTLVVNSMLFNVSVFFFKLNKLHFNECHLSPRPCQLWSRLSVVKSFVSQPRFHTAVWLYLLLIFSSCRHLWSLRGKKHIFAQ